MYLMISKFHKFRCSHGLCYSQQYFILYIEHGDLRFTTQGTMMENPWMYPTERKQRNLCGRTKFLNFFCFGLICDYRRGRMMNVYVNSIY
jgi:hypothetical protein